MSALLPFHGLSLISSLLVATSSSRGDGEWAPDLDLTGFLKRCLVCADLHCFFLPIILSPGTSAGCHGDLRPARRVIRGLDSLCDCWLGHSDGKVGYVSGRWVSVAVAAAGHLINAAMFTDIEWETVSLGFFSPPFFQVAERPRNREFI